MSNHRLALGGGWTVWRDVELRSAGFPADWIAGLADPALARQIDETVAAAPPKKGRPAPYPALEAAVTTSLLEASARIRELARDASFREAITWQNRRVMHRGIESLLRQADGHVNSKIRQNEHLVASYAQRYCCKNERAGYFGASTPARIVESGPSLAVRPGPGLIRQRATYLEPWAIDALADRLTSAPELRALVAPRRMPTIRLDGTMLVHSGGKRTALPESYARVVAACDGETSAERIAEALGDLGTASEVYELIDELVGERVLTWALDIPTTGGAPERLLRAELDRLAPSEARDRAMQALDTLERARDAVAAAAGSPERVDQAIDALERTFVELTGQDGVRNHGEAYAGRTLVGEDCVRDVDVEIGPAVMERLSGPLQLVLQSARWFTFEIARRYRAAFDALYRELRGDGPSTVDYSRVHARLPELFPQDARSIVDDVVDELHARWRTVLGIRGDERRVERTVAALRDGVMTAFAAPCPGWPSARHHSPDVLLAADGADAIARGDFLAVLGEIHVGMNSLLVPEVPNAKGDPDAPFALRDLDLEFAGIAPVWSRRRSRLDYYSRSPGDHDLEVGPARSWRPRTQVVALADLVLDEVDGALVVRTLDGRLRWDIIAFHEHYLLGNSFSEFGLLAGSHVPRVVVDGVVLVRERWVVSASDLAFAAADPDRRFIEARVWARSLELPRRIFIKVPEETKPMFVDLASPTFVDLASKLVRKAATVSMSEMLPDLDQLWLVDAAGRRYTSEFRIVAVDPEPWRRA